MSLTSVQRDALIKAINPDRVSKDGKGFSHVEAYDVRRRLIEIFDFGGWSGEVTDMSLIFEDHELRKKKNSQDEYVAWTVAYRATYQLTIHATGAVYTESATGEATNQPGRGDAHDLALKTAESQAFKRAAMNLGSQMGLSLYAKGSTRPIVRHILVNDLMRIDVLSGEITRKEGPAHAADIDTGDHVDGPVEAETDESAPAVKRPSTSDLDEQAAQRKRIPVEQERAERLAEGKVRRDAADQDSSGKTVKTERGRVERIHGRPPGDDPWAATNQYNNPSQADIEAIQEALDV